MPSSPEFWGADRRKSDTWPDIAAGDRQAGCFSVACYSLAVGTPAPYSSEYQSQFSGGV